MPFDDFNSDILCEIASSFNAILPNGSLSIKSLPEDYPAWVVAGIDWIGVAIPCEYSEDFYDKFSNIILENKTAILRDSNYRLLRLICSKKDLFEEFSYICAQFVTPGINGERRKRYSNNPNEWSQNWQKLFGNSLVNKTVYPIIAEMLVCYVLASKGKKVDWRGPNGATVDIEVEKKSYEVKSTVKRNESVANISSIYQLQNKNNRELSLIFCRMEPSVIGNGYSINNLVKELVAHGISDESIEESLKKHGLPKGTPARNEFYKILEMKEYPITNCFPRITPESFVNGYIPQGIIDFTYSINLSGLECQTFNN